MVSKIRKRDGRIVDFDEVKIYNAISKACKVINNEDCCDIKISKYVKDIVKIVNCKFENKIPSVEDIQDIVEKVLVENKEYDIAKEYILYRDRRNRMRQMKQRKYKYLSDEFLSNYKHKDDPFPTELGKFIYYSTYSRPVPEENRRERWWETVARVVEFSTDLEIMAMKRQGIEINDAVMNRLVSLAEKIYDKIYNLKLFQSGRILWIGGTKSSYLNPLSNFNCSFMTIDNFHKFSEMFLLLMLGTGVGFSIEHKYVDKLPKVNSSIELIHKDYEMIPVPNRKEYTEIHQRSKDMIEIVIGDSRFGWSKALDNYFDIITSKQYTDIKFILINYDNIRPAGERLKTFGGFASGHNAIKKMFQKIDNIFKSKQKANHQQWQTFKPIDCLDIATIIAENVVSGGTRRSAEIAICDKDEQEVLEAKSNIYIMDENGNWIPNDKIFHRSLSNNTVLYYSKPTMEELRKHFNLIRYSGEPAFANMQEMKRRRPDAQGANPCFEIILRDRGVCNLTELNMMAFVNPDGTYNREEMLETQRLSAIIGYRMATVELELHEWNMVNQEDRLIGCSLTGMMDFVNATGISIDEFVDLLEDLRRVAHESAYEMADRLKMNKPKLVTAIKPSGTISNLPTVSSGIHFSHSPYYIRRVRVSANTPIAKALVDFGFKWKPEVNQTVENHSVKVFEFPVKAPKGRTKYDVSAVEQLEIYRLVMKYYADHNASNTIHVRNHEWEDVINWVYNKWDDIVGVTFLSLNENFYQLMPFEAISEEQYEKMVKETPKFNPEILRNYEDFSDEYQILDKSCDSGACPIR